MLHAAIAPLASFASAACAIQHRPRSGSLAFGTVDRCKRPRQERCHDPPRRLPRYRPRPHLGRARSTGTIARVISGGRHRRGQSYRPACCGNASCIPICPVQSKYDATIHFDRAKAAGGDALHEDRGGRRRSRRESSRDGHPVHALGRQRGRATAKVFVLAAHAIETPRLLLELPQTPGAARRFERARPP